MGTNQWAAIEQQVRQCFVQEDAPEHLAILEKHLLALHEGGSEGVDTSTDQWRALTRSIHTLKGSAGLSQLHNLSKLAHRLEDVLLALGDRRLPDPALAVEVLLLGVDEMGQHLKVVAQTDRDCEPSPLLENIDLLLSQAESREAPPSLGSESFWTDFHGVRNGFFELFGANPQGDRSNSSGARVSPHLSHSRLPNPRGNSATRLALSCRF